MIVKQLPNTNPQIYCFDAGVLKASVLHIPNSDTKLDFGICTCTWPNKRFANPDNPVEAKNDIEAILFRSVVPSDAHQLKLEKFDSARNSWVVIANHADLSSGLYGKFYQAGTFNNTNQQKLYIGLQLDWGIVYQSNSGGRYRLIRDSKILGKEEQMVYGEYLVLKFCSTEAIGTVKIIGIQNGTMIKGDFDYAGMNWKQELRIDGELTLKQPTIEEEYLLDGGYSKQQISSKTNDTYQLESKLLTGEQGYSIIHNYLKSNQLLLYNFNPNSRSLLGINVRPTGIDNYQMFRDQQMESLKIEFEDQVDDLKRN